MTDNQQRAAEIAHELADAMGLHPDSIQLDEPFEVTMRHVLAAEARGWADGWSAGYLDGVMGKPNDNPYRAEETA